MSDDKVVVCDHENCECEPSITVGDMGWYARPLDDTLRQAAVEYATEIIVAVNTTTAWVPQDTALFDMIYGFLKGQSVADPGVPPTDG